MAHIADVKAPLVVVHGERDSLIPMRFGRKLFDAAMARKEFVVREGEGHTPPIGPVWDRIQSFLAATLRR